MEDLQHYEVLGVPQNSPAVIIKKAYHRLARQHHPDRARNGDVEIFKRATLAYETLIDQNKRVEYDALIDRAKLQPPKPQWFSQSPASQAAASAAFKAATPNASPEEKTYRKRPQQTKFSKKTGESCSGFEAHGPKVSQTYSGESSSRTSRQSPRSSENSGTPRAYSHSQAHSHPLSQSYSVPRPNRKLRRPQEQPSVVDLTEEADPTITQRKAFQRSRTEASAPLSNEKNPRKPAKRSAGSNDNLTEESPNKRMRVFDFSEMKATPPFTQKHGSSFQFDKVNEALHEDFPSSSTIPRQHNRQTAQADTERVKQFEKAHFQSKQLLNQYTAESLPALEELFRLHENRVHMCETPRVNPQDVLQSFLETGYLLEVLLAGTRECINHMN